LLSRFTLLWKDKVGIPIEVAYTIRAKGSADEGHERVRPSHHCVSCSIRIFDAVRFVNDDVAKAAGKTDYPELLLEALSLTCRHL